MELVQALQIIEQALNASAQKGVFGLQDSAVIFNALNVLKSFKPNEGVEDDKPSRGKLAGTTDMNKVKK